MPAPKSLGMLYLIPTVLAPDTAALTLPAQVTQVIGQTDHFFVENVRTARRFIGSLRLGRPVDTLQFYLLDKDTPAEETRQQLSTVLAGGNAGVLSEAGCPGVADPGAVAVAWAHRLGATVVPLVGPSAILLALMGSGFSGQSFAFHGYLPIEKEARALAIRQLDRDARGRQQTQIFMETPFRNDSLLRDLLQLLPPDTRLCIACNLTAPDQWVRTLPVKDWRNQPPDLHKKPTIFLVG